jgi:uncharacterized protein YjbI with pentapeptide repeats
MLLNNILLGIALWVSCLACTVTATTPTTIRASEITEKLRKQALIFYENVTIEGDLDFTSLTAYPETVTSRRVLLESPVFFKNCVFTGKLLGFRQVNGQSILCNFQRNLTFDSCRFDAEVNFQSITVAGIACFSKCRFNRPLSVEGAKFQSEAYFDEAMFAQEARFQDIVFGRSANFWKSVWAGVVYFQGVTYQGNAQFGLTDFRNNVDFSLSRVNGLFTFNYAQLTGRASFNNCHFYETVDFGNSTLKEASFAESFFNGKTSFSEATSKHLSFKNAYFQSQKPDLTLTNIPLSQLDLTGAKVGTFSALPIRP